MSESPERLQKVLARAGVGSRRSVEDLIRQGRIMVNGRTAELGVRVDPHKDEVEIDGSRVPLSESLVHYLLNKPAGVVSSATDPIGRPLAVDIVDVGTRVWAVGRLDMDTEGALVVTNDGDLTQGLTHPSFRVPKTYLAEVTGAVGGRALRDLERGVALEDGMTAPASARVVERREGATLVELTLSEGRNRQVRRMLEAVGHPVERLVRTRIGPLALGRLKPGAFRRLSPQEVRSLYRAAGL